MIDKAAILIKKAALEFEKVANPIFAEYDLTASQYKILKFLYASENHSARLVDLEKEYSMTHPTAIGLVNTLEEKGFVARTTNPDSARGKLIVLTEKADFMQEELLKLGDAVEDKLTERLTSEERAELIALLQKLLGLGN
mgnify:FL=1